MKNTICTIFGMVGAAIAAIFGGWDSAMILLVIAMCIDYISGIIVAGVFHASKKSESGALESRAGWKGLCRKGMTLLIVLVCHWVDLVIGVNYIRDAAVIGFTVNEIISITENAGLMGIPMPSIVAKAIDILTKKSNGEGGDQHGDSDTEHDI